MPKKRGQGEGTISKREDGTWWGRVTVGVDADGKQKRKAFYGKSRSEVQKKMTAAINELNNGVYVEPSKLTFGAWLDVWMAEYKKNGVKTYAGYDQAIRLYIKPIVGNIKLNILRSEQLQSVVNDMADKNFSTSTIHQVSVILNASLKQALKNGHIQRNPADALVIPKTHKKVSRAATVEEQRIIMRALTDNKFGLAFLLDMYTGMRKGEIIGLKWPDIDFDKKRITVNRTLDRVKNFNANAQSKTKIVINTPKSDSGFRTIPFENEVVNLLKIQRRRQAELMLSMGGCYKDEGYVFTNDFGKHLEPRYFSKVFEDLRKETGITDLTIHSLRHTFATRALESGVDMKVLQDILGHADYGVTANIYAHVLEGVKTESMSKVSDTITAIGNDD